MVIKVPDRLTLFSLSQDSELTMETAEEKSEEQQVSNSQPGETADRLMSHITETLDPKYSSS